MSIFGTMLEQNTQQNHAEISAYITPFNRMLRSHAVPMMAPGFGTQLLAAAYMTAVGREMSKAVDTGASVEQFIDLPAFAQALESAAREWARSHRVASL